MNSRDPEMDPVESMLRRQQGAASNELRGTIQNKTIGVLRRRRRLQRASWMTGMAGCYAAGILTMALMMPDYFKPRNEISAIPEIERGAVFAPVAKEPQNPNAAQPPETALALEWRALDSPDRRPDLFQAAGDKYLQANDLESAMRCYRGALDRASEKELHINVKDNWLFMSLKEAKMEENRYAKLDRP